jgi:hypothetical protein
MGQAVQSVSAQETRKRLPEQSRLSPETAWIQTLAVYYCRLVLVKQAATSRSSEDKVLELMMAVPS